MHVRLIDDSDGMARAAADSGAGTLRTALAQRGEATVVVATGLSQLAMLRMLVRAPGIDWTRVTVFHLDEYIALPETHLASFRRYLRERFLAHLPQPPTFIPVDGDALDLTAELRRLNRLLAERPVDLCFAGVGENAHLAFNDPPADFDVGDPYIAVRLDDACRRQQLGEGWFATLEEVPQRAISMSIRQIMRSQHLVLTVPELRKAQALRAMVEGPVDPACPASIVQRHPNCVVYVDSAAASMLRIPPLPTH